MNSSTDDRIRAARDYYDTHDASDEIVAADLTAHDPSESSALAGYSVRLPVEVLNQARALAKEQGVTTGAWLREAIENAVAARKTTTDTVPVSALLGLVQQYALPTRSMPARIVQPGQFVARTSRTGNTVTRSATSGVFRVAAPAKKKKAAKKK